MSTRLKVRIYVLIVAMYTIVSEVEIAQQQSQKMVVLKVALVR